MKEEVNDLGAISGWMIFLFGLLLGILSVNIYQSHINTEKALVGADYVEYRLNDVRQVRSFLNENMTIREFKMFYDRYTFASRGLLESEVNRMCSGYKVKNQSELDNKVINSFEVYFNESSR